MAKITLIQKGAVKASYTLSENESLTVGRNADCGISIDDTAVSAHHGRFYFENGEIYYADSSSTNGSFIGNERITSAGVRLYDGAFIALSGVGSAVQLKVDITGGDTPQRSAGRITIGRDPSCTVVLTQINASRFHASITVRRDGVYIEDNHSTNGTYVNGARITRPCRITEQDHVHIAGVHFRLANGALIVDDNEQGLPVCLHSVSRKVYEKGSEKTLLDKISLKIEPNEFVAIMGGSGAGKSTLMKSVCGIVGEYEGTVALDASGADSRAYKSVIGYAPQDDILYDDLTLESLLMFSARLKMPDDTQLEEYRRRVSEAIHKVQLDGHEHTLVKKLSGGQRKRASIAIELLSNPRLFFLDEPTSGLDPATERSLMGMLKDMAKDNRTIVAVTHITQNISLCDKVIVLGRGGRLCFFGSPSGACAFFEVGDFVDIYDKVNNNPELWQQKYIREFGSGADGATPLKRSQKISKSSRNSGWGQFLVLTERYFRLTVGDTKRLMLLLLQAPVLGILIMIVSVNSADDGVFTYSKDAKSLLFSLTCAAFWVGMLNSIQEICKERAIYERERISTLRILPYVFSKLVVIGLFSAFQAFALVLVTRLCAGALPENSLDISPFGGYFMTAYLTTLTAACLGLAVSALSPKPDQAMAVAPLLLLPQILFADVIFELEGLLRNISSVIPCKLSMQGFGTLTDFNALNISEYVPADPHDMYEATNANLYWSWAGLGIFALVCVIVFAGALKKTRENN